MELGDEVGSTPEGKIKREVKKLLAEFGDELYSHWPVQNGMGSPTLDCIVCYYGNYIAIETKAPGKSPTPRQIMTMESMRIAGAIVYVIDGDAVGLDGLRNTLNLIKWSHANCSQPKA